MPHPGLDLAMVAGETSGDILAGLLLQGLKRHWPQLHSAGIGGPRMKTQGFDAWADAERLSVFGYVEAIKRLPELLWLRHRVRRRILQQRPRVFVGVDAPDFNFGLETGLRQRGIPTVHFVCPSIWAWRAHRVQRLKAAADHVLCLFPFEPPLLAEHGIGATYVGHPLADAIADEASPEVARRELGLPTSAEAIVALLPGSRMSEIRHIAPVLLQAAQVMRRSRPGLHFVLPVAPGVQTALQALLQTALPGESITVVQGQSHAALAACDVALVASGTATLETALFKRPMVIVYRLAEADWRRMKSMRLQPWVGLPNILCREFIVPERIQEDADPALIARDALAWLDDGAAVDRLKHRCVELHGLLRQDTGAQAARALGRFFDGR